MADTVAQRYRAIVEYDGTNYFGFQRQLTHISIQSELEKALEKICKVPTTITGAGRTDTGVHARGQVISFVLSWRHGPKTLLKALNAYLPDDIAVVSLDETDSKFHPRFAARQRAYRYTIRQGAVRRPLERNRCWHVRTVLDIGRMNEAAALLVGEHDFATFGTPPQGNNTVRDVFVAQWQKQDNDFLTFDIVATAFLKRMVRSIVGSLKLVGDGSWSVNDFNMAFKSADRSRSGAAAPPQGLVLESVLYE